MIGRQHFNEVVLADFEYSQPPGDRPRPICLVARELVSGRTHRLFGEELLARSVPPYPTGPDSLFIAYRSEEHTSELQSPCTVVCRLMLEKTQRDFSTALAKEAANRGRTCTHLTLQG